MNTDRADGARERVLTQAEILFSERGYDSVTLRDIAESLGIRQASLYYHAPGGKQQLYVEAMERMFERHRVGLEKAMSAVAGDLQNELRAAARWLLSQPPMNLSRFLTSDLSAIDPENRGRLVSASYRALLAPIEASLHAARDRKEVGERWNLTMMAGVFVTVVESFWDTRALPVTRSREAMADEYIDVLLMGLVAG